MRAKSYSKQPRTPSLIRERASPSPAPKKSIQTIKIKPAFDFPEPKPHFLLLSDFLEKNKQRQNYPKKEEKLLTIQHSSIEKNNKKCSFGRIRSVTPLKLKPRSQSKSKQNLTSNEKTGQNFIEKTATSKKKTRYPSIRSMVPSNLEQEKLRFFSSEFKYDPQFTYDLLKSQKESINIAPVHEKLVALALKILHSASAKQQNSNENFLSQEETIDYFKKYIESLGADPKKFEFRFSGQTISNTSIAHKKNGRTRITISLPIKYTASKILDVLNHEIGTHFVRKHNNSLSPFGPSRKSVKASALLPTEEGLASLSQLFESSEGGKTPPLLFQPALNYYSAFLAQKLSFSELFWDLRRFVKDPERLWAQCMRVKRGVFDTSRSGGMFKDQSYLIGAVKILKKRKELDFEVLFCGKISVKECLKLQKEEVKKDGCLFPYFLRDGDRYKKALDRIAHTNFLA